MLDVIIDSLIDSSKVLFLALIIHFILSFIEDKMSHFLSHSKGISPIVGASFGLIPQCGISIVAADLYKKKHISVGTILAVFFACSDEALPIILSSKDHAIYLIPLLLIKFIFGFVLGYVVDMLWSRQEIDRSEVNEIHTGCCSHEIDNHEESFSKKHIIHPLIHSLKIFIYVFIVNLIFGTIIFFVTEERLLIFLEGNTFFTPLLSCIIGLIPNCASSVLITELFLLDGINFGALVGGLCVNSGLGFIYLLKYKEKRIEVSKLIGILLIYSLIISYLISLVMYLI